MSDCTAVYTLESQGIIDPRFEGLRIGPGASSVLGNSSPYDDLRVENPQSLDWRPPSLAKVWKPLPVTGQVNPFNDYPSLCLINPVFSRRAVIALGDMLTSNGELLPLLSDSGDYCLFIVLTKLDALNKGTSQITRVRDGAPAIYVDYFDFDASRLAGASIFRIPELPNYTLVTNRFKDRVAQSGLNGLRFVKVWPLPEGADWEADQLARDKSNKATRLQGEAVVIRLHCEDATASASEHQLAADAEASLAATLKVDSLDAPYRGSIEVAEFADGEFRVFCTCPDAEQLADFLKPWLDHVAWEGDIAITKRFGNLYDKKAKEKRVQVRGDSPHSRRRK